LFIRYVECNIFFTTVIHARSSLSIVAFIFQEDGEYLIPITIEDKKNIPQQQQQQQQKTTTTPCSCAIAGPGTQGNR